MIHDVHDLPAFEQDILEHYQDVKAQAGELGNALQIQANDDQMVAALRSAGWSEIAIGGYLLVEALTMAGDLPPGCCPSSLMVACVYSRGGRVR